MDELEESEKGAVEEMLDRLRNMSAEEFQGLIDEVKRHQNCKHENVEEVDRKPIDNAPGQEFVIMKCKDCGAMDTCVEAPAPEAH